MRYLRVIKYFFMEMLPSFLLGIIVFASIPLMFQVLRLTEFVLTHGVTLKTVFQLVGFFSISFLPMILPMSVLFSVIMTYGRLSSDSEIIALKSLGVSQKTLTYPALLLGSLATLISTITFFYVAPWGYRQFDKLLSELGSTQVISAIREGTFAEGFYNLVVYANKINEQKGILKDVFIYDERSQSIPLTIIAKEGQILSEKGPSKTAVLRLFSGSIHRTDDDVYTKVQFDNYDIFLRPDIIQTDDSNSPKSMSISRLYHEMNEINKTTNSSKWRILNSEFHKRWSLPFACLIFSIIGVGLGTVVNRRIAKSGGFIVSIGLLVTYYVLYISLEVLATGGKLPPIVAISIPNFLFLLTGIYTLKLIWHR